MVDIVTGKKKNNKREDFKRKKRKNCENEKSIYFRIVRTWRWRKGTIFTKI